MQERMHHACKVQVGASDTALRGAWLQACCCGRAEGVECELCGAGASLHVCMTPHGPDAATFEGASPRTAAMPEHLPDDTLAFMFEARPFILQLLGLNPPLISAWLQAGPLQVMFLLRSAS